MNDREEILEGVLDCISILCDKTNICIISEDSRVKILDLETNNKYNLLRSRDDKNDKF
ncbi:hypothetical protein [Clostridioides difficile]|uniref:hypothetical protein n=1 Tax=Clostridioides difficile TaxID=1496 RepID=UPI00131D086E|nr:hypothetical protein [Clostridioides difficile]HBE9444628.1 hypothetical protein [Clostridioides difficile]